MSTKTILITGMSGLIGRVVWKQLEGKHVLVALNRHPIDGVRCYQADISDFDAILPAFRGVDTVVHLAGAMRGNPSWQEYMNTNIVGVYNTLEASRRAGVKRAIIASSGATVKGWEEVFPYKAIVEGKYSEVPSTWQKLSHESPVRPTNIYGATKVWGEALGRVYSYAYDISVICLRIGVVNREDRPLETRQFSVWCSQRDIATMVEKCVEAPASLKFDIFYVVSNNKWNYRDLEHARQVVGFVPQDSAERFR